MNEKNKKKREYYWKNRIKILKQASRWRKKNRIKEDTRMKMWRRNNPEKFVASRFRRDAKNLGFGGSFTAEQWKEKKKQFHFTCHLCGKVEPEIKLTVDHIIPKSKWKKYHLKIKYKYNDIKNIQPLCIKCNIKKGNKI